MSKKALIVIPTYNEVNNIESLLNALFSLTPKKHTAYDISVLVVDDNSPDGTGLVVRRLQKKYTGLSLLEGNKQGLGAAYCRGFDFALTKSDFDVLVMMDADFSHDPMEVPLLLDGIDAGNDVAIGSRFTYGGMIPGNWPLLRILNTKVAHFVTRYIGGIDSDLAELTGGFKAIRRTALESIPFQNASVKGFGFQIFLSNEFVQQRMKVLEVPIHFRDRRAGSSKMKINDIIGFVKLAAKLNQHTPFKRHISVAAASCISALLLILPFYLINSTKNIIVTILINLGLVVLLGYFFFHKRDEQSDAIEDKELN